MKPVVAIVGRANVGKSTLFNRFLKNRKALVYDRPGVTRDRIFGLLKREVGGDVWLVDTGGLLPDDIGQIQEAVSIQVQKAVEESVLVLVVFDGRDGLTPVDQEVVERVRQIGRPMIGVVNKVDPGSRKGDASDFHRTGISPILEISAEHGSGIDDLLSEVLSRLPKQEEEETPLVKKGEMTFAFLGRPNVGKSSLVNAILKEPRQIVSEIAGTTRDTVDTSVERGKDQFVLLDTAGIRKKHKVIDSVEHFSVVKALQSIARADVVILVTDASDSMTTQDSKIASAVIEKGAGLLVAVNKWDLKNDSPKERANYRDELYAQAPFLDFAAIRFVSAKTGVGVEQILSDAKHVSASRRRKFTPEQLARAFHSISVAHPPSGIAGIRLRLDKMTQADEPYPTFFVWCNNPKWIETAYGRYWTNAVRRALRLEGVPSRVVFRRKIVSGAQKTKSRSRRRRSG